MLYEDEYVIMDDYSDFTNLPFCVRMTDTVITVNYSHDIFLCGRCQLNPAIQESLSLRMDENLYDEFGNYIGPELQDSDDENEDMEFEDENLNGDDYEDEHHTNGAVTIHDGGAMDVDDENRIVLHEDKKYFPDADEVYPGVRTVTLYEDSQPIEEPIIKPIRVKNFSVLEKEQPALNYTTEFMTTLMNTPTLIKNIALLGNFHHGKTLFLDTLIQSTQEKKWDVKKYIRYSDTRKDEQDRELSIKSTSVTLVMEDLTNKSYLLNILDCPGHVNFSDEYSAALRIADGAVIVIDAVEGVMMQTERMIKHALMANVPICVVR